MYFKSPGKGNTEKTVELALREARTRGIKNIVVASISGYTAGLFKGNRDMNVVCVSHVNGFTKKGENDMPKEVRQELENSGIKVLTTTHVLSGAERGISRRFSGAYPVEIIAQALRMFGEGVKVCVEIAIMALDAGLIPYGEPVIALGGTGRGADAAIIITPSHAASIFETKIHEIICKPF